MIMILLIFKFLFNDSVQAINNYNQVFMLYNKYNISPSYQIDPNVKLKSLLFLKHLFELTETSMFKNNINFDSESNNKIFCSIIIIQNFYFY